MSDAAAVPPPADDRGHRVKWFGPDRPVDGGTVFERPPDDGPAEAAEPAPHERPEDPEMPFRYEIEVWYPQLDGSHTWEVGKATPADLAARLRHEADQVETVGSWTYKPPAEQAPRTLDDVVRRDLRKVLPIVEAAEAGAPEPAAPEPGYPRIADAINAACEAADIDLTVVHDGRVLDYVPGVRWLATVLDKAGLIDWAAFQDGAGSVATAPAAPELLVCTCTTYMRARGLRCEGCIEDDRRAGSVSSAPAAGEPLTFELYEHIVNLAYAAHLEWYPIQKWRRGQAYANVLHTLAPRIQERMEKDGRDVFYRDDLIPAYLDEVRAALAGSATPPEESSK